MSVSPKGIGYPRDDGLCRCDTGRHGTRHSQRELGFPWEGRSANMDFRVMSDFTI
jgi:hypothetical protein